MTVNAPCYNASALGRLQNFAHAPRAVVVQMPRQGEPMLFASNRHHRLVRNGMIGAQHG